MTAIEVRIDQLETKIERLLRQGKERQAERYERELDYLEEQLNQRVRARG